MCNAKNLWGGAGLPSLDHPLHICPAHLDDQDLWRKNIKLDHPFATDQLIQMIRIILKKKKHLAVLFARVWLI